MTNNPAVPANCYVALALLLFTIGTMGVLWRRNGLVVLMSIELMLNAINLIFVVYSQLYHQIDGQLFGFFMMVLAASESAVGLALWVGLFRTKQGANLQDLTLLRDET